MRMRSGASVDPIDRADPRWKLNLGQGCISAATWWSPPARTPSRPCPPGQGMASFPGTVIHAGQSRSTEGMAGRDVLVVSPGNSGADCCSTLSAAMRASCGRRRVRYEHHRVAVGRDPAAPVQPRGPASAAPVQDANVRLVERLAFRDLPRYGSRVLSSAPAPGWLRKGSWRPSTAGSSRRRKPDGHGEARR
jgi:putative flavoprotein involved in K+ transport